MINNYYAVELVKSLKALVSKYVCMHNRTTDHGNDKVP